MRAILLVAVGAIAVNFLAQLVVLGHWETHYRYGGIGEGWLLAWRVVSFPLQQGALARTIDAYWLMYANAGVWGVAVGGIAVLVRKVMRIGGRRM
jgi:hypothetical protein